ncbi:DivIVA domain-containing protein [Spirosoma sp.]|uniref:DivIVA domain-containing protein n=1 Tax=Spirosoma sp. TaxID=1899569 RepID=UPI0026153C36|nr:DivIVA domain-containing protein [Spirosoma sp.]MCX6213280.1 DivIVA domain-containing protein [Spirosoma sp.]
MKITPIEIRQHTFEKGLRGYKTEEVDAFLASLSQEWERLTGEYKMLKMQLELAEKELGKLKEVEMTLFRTLKTAEDTSVQITDQANKAGEKYIDEARQKADEMLADARKRSALMVQDAENQARYLKDNILNDIKSLEHDFKALESYKENLAVQIRTLASNAVDSVDRFEKKFSRQNLKGKIDDITVQLTDELKQPETDALPDAVTPTDTAAELPPLIDREESVPEAIPIDEAVMEKLEDALHTDHQTATPTATETTDESPSEPLPTEVDTIDPEGTPVASTEEASTKKTGSFFDQI